MVPDQARLYGRNTAPEYLDHFGFLYGIPEAIRRRRIADLLERFELADRKNTVLAAYSRGMAQKVALIRATLHEPDWIFCDEPTAGLDPVAAADMRRYLDEQRSRGAALIVTTHVLSEAELMADRIAIMRRGVVVTTGALDDLRRQAGQGRRFIAHLARPGFGSTPWSTAWVTTGCATSCRGRRTPETGPISRRDFKPCSHSREHRFTSSRKRRPPSSRCT